MPSRKDANFFQKRSARRRTVTAMSCASVALAVVRVASRFVGGTGAAVRDARRVASVTSRAAGARARTPNIGARCLLVLTVEALWAIGRGVEAMSAGMPSGV